jgi:hypothetical protein
MKGKGIMKLSYLKVYAGKGHLRFWLNYGKTRKTETLSKLMGRQLTCKSGSWHIKPKKEKFPQNPTFHSGIFCQIKKLSPIGILSE